MNPYDQLFTGIMDTPGKNMTAAEMRAQAIADGSLPAIQGTMTVKAETPPQDATPD